MLFQRIRLVLVFLIAVAVGLTLMAEPCLGRSPHSLSLGARYHKDHSVFTDRPFGDGDISYALAYEYSERLAYWQLALDFAPDVSGTRDSDGDDSEAESVGTDFVLTPQLNLVFTDRFFRAGPGIRGSYIRDDEGNSEWIGPNWQLQLGVNLPFGEAISIDGNVYYVLESWGNITDFAFGDLEYGVWLKYTF